MSTRNQPLRTSFGKWICMVLAIVVAFSLLAQPAEALQGRGVEVRKMGRGVGTGGPPSLNSQPPPPGG